MAKKRPEGHDTYTTLLPKHGAKTTRKEGSAAVPTADVKVEPRAAPSEPAGRRGAGHGGRRADRRSSANDVGQRVPGRQRSSAARSRAWKENDATSSGRSVANA